MEWVPQLISGISGPASGVIVAVLSLAGFGWFLVKHLLPGHERQIDKILDSHKEDRVVFKDAITGIGHELKSLTVKVENISDKLGDIEDDVKDLKSQDRDARRVAYRQSDDQV
jgi:hypothetical protein